MNSELREAIPDPDPDKSALADFGLAALAAFVPGGGAISDLARGSMARRDSERRKEFDLLVVAKLEEFAAAHSGITPTDVLDSDEFMAAYAKASRIAGETSSQSKRALLATALTHCGPWDFSSEPVLRMRFLDIIERSEEQHVFLLKFLADPMSWITANQPGFFRTNFALLTLQTVVSNVVMPTTTDGMTLQAILRDISSDGLAEFNLSAGMTLEGVLAPKTTALGNAFLAFLGQTPKAE